MVSGDTPSTPLISPKLVTGLDNYIICIQIISTLLAIAMSKS